MESGSSILVMNEKMNLIRTFFGYIPYSILSLIIYVSDDESKKSKSNQSYFYVKF